MNNQSKIIGIGLGVVIIAVALYYLLKKKAPNTGQKPTEGTETDTTAPAVATDSQATNAPPKINGGLTLGNYKYVPLKQRNFLILLILGKNMRQDWAEAQWYEWIYAYLKGAQYFYCQKCSLTQLGYYKVSDLSFSRGLGGLPMGAKYVEHEGGEVRTR